LLQTCPALVEPLPGLFAGWNFTIGGSSGRTPGGGPSTAASLRVLCKSHNLQAARLALGDAVMDRFTRMNRPRPQAAPPPPRGVG
jgi:hypothetical protein